MRAAARLLLMALALGCAGHAVVLVAPAGVSADNCLQTCERLFGKRPTLTCGERAEPRRMLVCSYEPAPWPLAQTPADAPCRAECARAGIGQIEGCWELKTRAGEPTVACQYRSAFK